MRLSRGENLVLKCGVTLVKFDCTFCVFLTSVFATNGNFTRDYVHSTIGVKWDVGFSLVVYGHYVYERSNTGFLVDRPRG